MTSLLETGPEREPVSAQQLRDHLRVNEGDDDLLNSLITAARMTIEAQSGLRLITQSWQVFFDDWPADTLELSIWPVQSITRVVLTGHSPIMLDPGLYELVKQGRPALVEFQHDRLPPPQRRRAGIRIDLQVGYGDTGEDVHESLVLAVLALAAHWYDIDDWNQYGVEAAIPPHVQTLIAQHRLLRL
jgi:uncharacterized phiE125 gp8 family phage protein